MQFEDMREDETTKGQRLRRRLGMGMKKAPRIEYLYSVCVRCVFSGGITTRTVSADNLSQIESVIHHMT